MSIKILHRFNGSVLYESSTAQTMREAILEAIKRSANLSFADLRSANLRFENEKKSALVSAFKGSASRSDGYVFIIFTSSDLGNIIRAGCRTFTLEEYRAHVAAEYPDSPKAEETIRILNYLEGCLTQQEW